jgi:hypothetical protein
MTTSTWPTSIAAISFPNPSRVISLADNDPEQACTLAEEALDHLARYWYATGMDRVRTVRESLTKWESLPCVRRLDERLYDWNTTVNALTG